MQLSTQDRGDITIVRVDAARIDASSAIQFKDAMRHLTQQAGSRIVLDLEQVDFIDSSGLGAIVAAMKNLAPGQRLDLAALSPMVEKVFRMTRMDTIFVIHANAASAHGTGAG